MSANLKSTKSHNTCKKTVLASWSRQQKLAVIACFAILAVLLALSACSETSSKPAMEAMSSPATNSPAASSVNASVMQPTQANTVAAPAQTAGKKTPKKRAANVSYNDANTGLTFVYPRKFALSTGDKAQPQLDGDAVPMNFVEAGGVPVASVALPNSLYPKTDFADAFFSANVNRSLSEEQCSHFAFVDTSNADGEPVDAEKVKVGTADMEMTSEFAGSATRQAEAQYYHQFENGACYEYVLGLGTAGYGTTEGIAPVDRDEVFARLEKILASVKIRALDDHQTEQPELTAAGSAK